MATSIKRGVIALVLLLCLMAQARAAEMWRNLETIGGYDGYVSNVYTPYFQDNDFVRVGGWGDWYVGMIRFDVNSFPSNVYGVSLWYYVSAGGSSTVPMTMYAMATPFGPSQYWLNGVYIYTNSPRSVPAPQNSNWMVIDITDYYRNWKSGAYQNQGILLMPTANNNQFNNMSSANFSTLASRKPFLLVSYPDSVPQPTSQFLSFPLPSSLYPQGAYTAGKINSVVDHSMNRVYLDKDGKILSFTGEVFQATSVYPAGGLYACYPKVSGTWSSLLQNLYKGTGQSGGGSSDCRVNKALNYEAHPGYDYVAAANTVVKTAALGKVINFNGTRCIPKGISNCADWGAVAVDHNNGYVTQYLHMNRVDVTFGQTVTEGMQLGLSGTKAPGGTDPHLHFEVLKRTYTPPPGIPDNIDNYRVVDPYGYDMSTGVPDYLAQVTGVTNVRLWK